jgi:hypothetical protein
MRMESRQFNRRIIRTDLKCPPESDWKVKTNNQSGVSSTTASYGKKKPKKKKSRSRDRGDYANVRGKDKMSSSGV